MKNNGNDNNNQGSGMSQQIRTTTTIKSPQGDDQQQQQPQRRRISSGVGNGLLDENDDDDVLDLAEQTNRPVDDSIHQQRVQAWHPILDPLWVIIGLFYMGIIFVPTSLKINSIQENVIELVINYDDHANYTYENNTKSGNKRSNNYKLNIINDTNLCGIGKDYNLNRVCNVSFTTPSVMYPPILFHYELDNFHQNHRDYFQSKDPHQLLGEVGSQEILDAKNCEPLNKIGGIQLYPCGLIANTLFNDYYKLIDGKDIYGNDLVLIEDGITWKTDIKYAYKQVIGFNSSICDGPCDESCCNPGDSCVVPYYNPKDGKCHRYYYPNDNTTQYLYETYPDIINPMEGVLNEHFMVWMRIAALPRFRKLYGYIDQIIPANTTITFQINANYVVTRFRGNKKIVLSTTSIFGGRNTHFYEIFLGFGIYCLIMGTIFAFKHFIRPRKLGDRTYLHYKEE